MSTPDKLRPSQSELTKFKALWRDSMSDDAKGYWQSLFVSGDFTQAQLRGQISTKLKINLRHDSQLNAFRDWELEQRKRDLEAERMVEDERRLMSEHPDWTLDQVREDVLKKSYFRARATGDFKLGLATMDRDSKVSEVRLQRDKFQFDAAKACLKALPQLKVISASKVSETEKVEQIRLKLFGVAA